MEKLKLIEQLQPIGGIGGDFYNGGSCNNSYSIGTYKVGDNIVKGNAIGVRYGTTLGTFTNCYGLDTNYNAIPSATGIVDCSLKTSADMKLQSFVDLLNTGQTNSPWQLDTSMKNDSYPIFTWQTE